MERAADALCLGSLGCGAGVVVSWGTGGLGPPREACLLGDAWFLPLSRGWRKFFFHLSSGNISFLFPKSKDPFLVNVSSDDDHAGSYLCHHRGSYCK